MIENWNITLSISTGLLISSFSYTSKVPDCFVLTWGWIFFSSSARLSTNTMSALVHTRKPLIRFVGRRPPVKFNPNAPAPIRTPTPSPTQYSSQFQRRFRPIPEEEILVVQVRLNLNFPSFFTNPFFFFKLGGAPLESSNQKTKNWKYKVKKTESTKSKKDQCINKIQLFFWKFCPSFSLCFKILIWIEKQ